ADLEKERKRATDAEAESAKAKPALEQKDKELDALRKAQDALNSADARAKRDRRAALRDGSDLAKALEALALPDALRDRVAQAFRDEVDREVLSREGPVVPVRGLRCPSCDCDLDGELTRLKTRRKQKDALRSLGVSELSQDDVKSLVEKLCAASSKA